MSGSSRPHELQHTRPPCPSLSPRVCSNSCPLSQWCHPTISSSVVPFSSCPQSFRVFSNESALCIMWPNYWSFSISPSNKYSGLISFRIDWCDLLAVQRILKSLLQHHSSKASILWRSAFFIVQLSHPYMTIGKTIALTVQTFVNKVMSLLFNTVSGFVTAILPRNKHLLILQLQLPSALILKLYKKMKSDTVSTFSPSICYKVIGPDAMIFVFWMLSFRPVFSLSSCTFIKRLFRSSSLSAIKVVLYAYLKLLIFPPATLIPIHPAQHFAWCTLHISYIKRVTIQPWHTPFPILNQPVVPYLVLTIASCLHASFSGGR